jgi:hypothetical protein
MGDAESEYPPGRVEFTRRGYSPSSSTTRGQSKALAASASSWHTAAASGLSVSDRVTPSQRVSSGPPGVADGDTPAGKVVGLDLEVAKTLSSLSLLPAG